MKKGDRGYRSDKKRDVKPTIDLKLKDTLYRLSTLTFTPVKDVCPKLCMYVLNDRDSIVSLSTYFKRDLLFDNTLFRGHLSNKTIDKNLKKRGERITMRLTNEEHYKVSLLAFSLDCTVSRATAILLELSMSHVKFVNMFVKNVLKYEISETQLKQFKEVLHFVNKHGEKQHSWASLLAKMVDDSDVEKVNPLSRLKYSISDFIDSKWND